MESKLKAAAQDSVGELPSGYLHLPTTPIKQEPELTDWVSGDLKPVRDGVYERDYADNKDNPDPVFCKFEKGSWFCYATTEEEAANEYVKSDIDWYPWRGLAKNPEVQS